MRSRTVLIGILSAVLATFPARAQSPQVDATVDAARDAARANRHEEAIDGYRRAMAEAPDRRRHWVLELADQLTWAGRHDEAIALYKEGASDGDPDVVRSARLGLARALSWQGDHRAAIAEYDAVLATHPEDREARLDRAKVLSWSHRHGAALAQYEAVLADDPGDRDAARGAARVLSWSGRHRAAAERMRRFLEAHPQDREAVIILAESLVWMGRADRAETVLRAHIGADPGHDRATALLAQIETWRRSEASIDVRVFAQSDDLEITEATLAARLPIGPGRGSVGVRYAHGTFTPPSGPVREIEVQRPMIEGQYRFNDAFAWSGAAGVSLIDTRGADGDHEIGVFDTYATFWPNDVVRIDVGAARWTFDSEAALRSGLYATQGGASLDITPDDRTRLSVRGSWTEYSDGNTRAWWQVQADRRVMRNPNVTIGYRYTGFDFSRPGQPGYYNPDLQHANDLLVRAYGSFGEALRWELRSAVGYEVEDPGQSRGTAAASASLTWVLGSGTELEGAYDYSSSRATSSTGFDRQIARLTLRKRF